MSYVYQVENMPHAGPMTDGYVWRDEVLEIAARADAQIAALQQSITIRDTEIARLETDLELARRDAERYRKLRGMHWSVPRDLAVTDGKSVKLGFMTYSGDRLDAVIDAAVARAGNGGAG